MVHKTHHRHGFVLRQLTTSIVLAMSLACMAQAQTSNPASSGAWVSTQAPIPDLGRAQYLGDVSDDTPVPVVVALKLQNQALMDSYILDLFRPGSPSFHQFMSPANAVESFAPSKAQAQAVADYLRQQGYNDIEIAPNRLVITAKGTARSAKQAFRTTLSRFVRQNEAGFANTNDVQIPAPLGGVVRSVLGLQTLNRVYTLPPQIQGSGLGSPSTNGISYYADEFAAVYHAGNTPPATSTDVAIIGWGSMANSVKDLAQFERRRNIAPVPTTVVSFGGLGGNDESGEAEWAMDAQAIVGISGGVKSLTFYTADEIQLDNGNLGATDAQIIVAMNRAVADKKAKIINMSFYAGIEYASDDIGFADDIFKLGVTQGQTFVAASGDRGSYPCDTPTPTNKCPVNPLTGNGSYGDPSIISVAYPASSPYVIAVGGTTLSADKNDIYIGEKAWSYSGGGISTVEPLPEWQSQVDALRGKKYRGLPDVAFDADSLASPLNYFLTQICLGDFHGIPLCVPWNNFIAAGGGTSLSAPLFVGAWARLESANDNSLGFAAPILYALAGKPGASFWLRDVSSGSNGAFGAGAGWDYATGWGSFDIEALATVLASGTNGSGGNGGDGSNDGYGGNGGDGGHGTTGGTGGNGGSGGTGEGSNSTGGNGGDGGSGSNAGTGGNGGGGGVGSSAGTGGNGGDGGAGIDGGVGGNGGGGGLGSGGGTGGNGGDGGAGANGGVGGNGGNGGTGTDGSIGGQGGQGGSGVNGGIGGSGGDGGNGGASSPGGKGGSGGAGTNGGHGGHGGSGG